MNRGNRREDILLTDKDRKVFLDGLADSCEIYHIKLYTFKSELKDLRQMAMELELSLQQL